MKITPLQQYIILGVGAFLGIMFLYYQFLLKPINAKIDTLQQTLSDKKSELEKAKNVVAKYVEFKKKSDSTQRELEWYQNRIPKTVEKTKLLEAINFLQSRSGVVLTSFTFGTPQSLADYSELPANVRFNSDYKSLINFLYQASVSNIFMIVHDLSITPNIDLSHHNFTLQAQMVVSGIQAKQ